MFSDFDQTATDFRVAKIFRKWIERVEFQQKLRFRSEIRSRVHYNYVLCGKVFQALQQFNAAAKDDRRKEKLAESYCTCSMSYSSKFHAQTASVFRVSDVSFRKFQKKIIESIG